jgi:hypothetical protein
MIRLALALVLLSGLVDGAQSRESCLQSLKSFGISAPSGFRCRRDHIFDSDMLVLTKGKIKIEVATHEKADFFVCDKESELEREKSQNEEFAVTLFKSEDGPANLVQAFSLVKAGAHHRYLVRACDKKRPVECVSRELDSEEARDLAWSVCRALHVP